MFSCPAWILTRRWVQAIHMAIDLPGSLQAISIAEVVGSFLAIPSLMKSVEAEIVQRMNQKGRSS